MTAQKQIVYFSHKWLFMRRLMSDPTLSPSARMVAYWLLDHLNGRTGQCNPSLNRLRGETGLSRSSVKRAIKELVACGIHTVRRGTPAFRTNNYIVNWEWEPSPGATVDPVEAGGEPSEGRGRGPDRGSRVSPKAEKEAMKCESMNEPGQLCQGRSGGFSVHRKAISQQGVDWNGWVKWLRNDFAIDPGRDYAFILKTLEQLSEQGGLTAQEAEEKLDVLFKVARKRGLPDPQGFIEGEVRTFIRRHGGS